MRQDRALGSSSERDQLRRRKDGLLGLSRKGHTVTLDINLTPALSRFKEQGITGKKGGNFRHTSLTKAKDYSACDFTLCGKQKKNSVIHGES